MFLSDKLLEIGLKTDLTSEESINNSCKLMFTELMCNLRDTIGNHTDDKTILANFKRVNNTWIEVVKILKNKGFYFLNENGFKHYVETKSPGTFFK